MAVNKIKMGKAIAALRKAGMSSALAKKSWRFLDLDKPFDPQIAEFVEEDPELFGLDEDGNELPDEEPEDEDDTPMTVREAQRARLKGGSAHLEKRTFRQPAQERKSTAPESAQKAAAHLREGHNDSAPNTPRYYTDAPKPRTVDRFERAAAPKTSSQQVADRLVQRRR